MNKEEQLYEQIERYFSGEMPEQERYSFEKQMESDPELEKKVRIVQASEKLVIQHRLRQVKRLLHEEAENVSKGEGSNYFIAFAGLLLLSAGVFYMFYPGSKTEKISIQKPVVQSTPTQPKEPVESRNVKPENLSEQPAQPQKPEEKILSVKEREISAKQGGPELVPTLPATDSTVFLQEVLEEKKVESTYVAIVMPDSHKMEVIKKPERPVKKDQCTSVRISADVFSLPACSDETNGEIRVSDVTGGKEPYHYFLDEKEVGTAFFGQLSAGTYQVSIKDANGCLKVYKSVVVEEKPCRRDYEFNPHIGQQWEVPVSEKPGSLVIYDKAGQIYYSEEIPADEKRTWDGRSRQGTIRSGYFIFMIKYQDGQILQGSVTIAQP